LPITIGLYAIGVLLVPGDRTLDIQLGAAQNAAEIRDGLAHLVKSIRGKVADDLGARRHLDDVAEDPVRRGIHVLHRLEPLAEPEGDRDGPGERGEGRHQLHHRRRVHRAIGIERNERAGPGRILHDDRDVRQRNSGVEERPADLARQQRLRGRRGQRGQEREGAADGAQHGQASRRTSSVRSTSSANSSSPVT